ncbi:type IV secretory system conjugative DNA transfer family protein [Nostocoides australiense]
MPISSLHWRQVHWPSPLSPDAALAVLRSLAADPTSSRVVLEARATRTGVSYLIGGSLPAVLDLARQLRVHAPGVQITEPDPKRTLVTAAASLRLSTRHRPLRTDDPEATVRAGLGAMSRVREGETLVLQCILGPRRIPLAVPNQSPSSTIAPLWQVVWYGNGGVIDGEKRTALRNKVADHGFACTVRLGVAAASPNRRRNLLSGLFGALRTAQAPGVVMRLRPDSAARLNAAARPLIWSLRLNASEVLALSAWPIGDEPLPGQPARHPRLLPPASGTTGAVRIIGKTTAPGFAVQLAQPVGSALRHTHVLGPTGTGKSTLLERLISEDIRDGRAVVVVDPQGDLVRSVLGHIPRERVPDVIVLDPADRDRPVGLNPLHGVGRDPEVVADGLLAIFKGLYGDGLGPRSQDILHASLLTLTRHPDASLVMLPLLLTNPGFRRSLTSSVNDPIALGPFWQWFESISEGERQAATAPLHNKLRPWLLRPSLRNVLGQRAPRVTMREVFEQNKILLVSLAQGQLGPEGANLLGALVVAELWQATTARANLAKSRRPPVMVYLDEFAAFMHLPTDLADALARSRGMGVSYTLAHQFLGQLTPGMRTAVLANTRSRICFQLSTDDAAVIARSAPELEPVDFTSLGAFELYASVFARDKSTPFASARTLPSPKAISRPGEVRAASRARYGQSLTDIEAEFAALASIGKPNVASTPGVRPGRAKRSNTLAAGGTSGTDRSMS